MKPVKDILVIDDEEIICEAVNKICSSEGLQVDKAPDVKKALDKMNSNEYKVFICDIMMPHIDGFGFLNELSQRDIHTPVIMTTGYSTVENAVQSLYMGAIDFIPKPFTVDELINAVVRAQNYTKVLKLHETEGSGILIVSCPVKYYRLGYSSWAAEESTGSMIIGATDMYIKSMESIKDLDLMNDEEEIVQGAACAYITDKEGRKHHLLSPLSGRIIEVNDSLKTNMSIVEKDPYFNGWFYRIIPAESDYELKNLIQCTSEGL